MMSVRIALVVAFGAALSALSTAQGRLIAVDSNRSLFEINQATGVKVQIGTVSSNAGTTAGLAYDAATGTMYLSSSSLDSLFTLDLSTGSATLVGSYGTEVVMHGLEWDSRNQRLFAASSTPNSAYTVSTTTGQATLLGSIGLSSFNNLGYDSINDAMYLTNSQTDSLYSFDRSNGSVELIGALGGSTNPNGLAFNSDNGRMYMVDNNTDSLYTLNLQTGAATLVGSTGTGNLLGLVYVPVPEPGTLAALGFGALMLARRRKRTST